jgi:hypothetical protein
MLSHANDKFNLLVTYGSANGSGREWQKTDPYGTHDVSETDMNTINTLMAARKKPENSMSQCPNDTKTLKWRCFTGFTDSLTTCFSPLSSGEHGIGSAWDVSAFAYYSLRMMYGADLRVLAIYCMARAGIVGCWAKGTRKTLTWLRCWLGGLRGHIFVQDCAPSVMGGGSDGGLDRSPRKRSDAERRNIPGLGTGMRLSSSLLLRLQPPVSPQTTPFILSITRTGTT